MKARWLSSLTMPAIVDDEAACHPCGAFTEMLMQRNRCRLLTTALVLLLPACAPQLSTTDSLRLTPAQAVINAAETPMGVSGVFAMVVRATGRQDGQLYLNSERDYRDPRNLTIVVTPAVERALEARLDGPVERVLAGREIAVRGTARKTRIDFFGERGPSGKYYYQTHLRLQSPSDLTVGGSERS